MPSENDGVMIVLSSPSGAGKTTLVKMLSKMDNYEISISHTTRQPRQNEANNKDYYFVNEDEFKRLISNEEFLEYAKVFNNFYGTTRTPVIDRLNKGKNMNASRILKLKATVLQPKRATKADELDKILSEWKYDQKLITEFDGSEISEEQQKTILMTVMPKEKV